MAFIKEKKKSGQKRKESWFADKLIWMSANFFHVHDAHYVANVHKTHFAHYVKKSHKVTDFMEMWYIKYNNYPFFQKKRIIFIYYENK